MFVEVPGLAPAVGPSSFILNATPAVNLFSHDAHPIRIDHIQPDYRIRPIARGSRSVEQIFSVDSVRARTAGGDEQEYHAFSAMRDEDAGSYHPSIRASARSDERR